MTTIDDLTLEDMGIINVDDHRLDEVEDLLRKIEVNTRKADKREGGTTVFVDDLEYCSFENAEDIDNSEYCKSYCPHCKAHGAIYDTPSYWRRLDIKDDFFIKIITLPIALIFSPLGTLSSGDYSLVNSNLTTALPEKITEVEEVKEVKEVKEAKEAKDDWLSEYSQAISELEEMKREEEFIREVEVRAKRGLTFNKQIDFNDTSSKSKLQIEFEKRRKIA